VVTRNKAGLVA
jgi:hypothetical protein